MVSATDREKGRGRQPGCLGNYRMGWPVWPAYRSTNRPGRRMFAQADMESLKSHGISGMPGSCYPQAKPKYLTCLVPLKVPLLTTDSPCLSSFGNPSPLHRVLHTTFFCLALYLRNGVVDKHPSPHHSSSSRPRRDHLYHSQLRQLRQLHHTLSQNLCPIPYHTTLD